jgi:hypothetical protein
MLEPSGGKIQFHYLMQRSQRADFGDIAGPYDCVRATL